MSRYRSILTELFASLISQDEDGTLSPYDRINFARELHENFHRNDDNYQEIISNLNHIQKKTSPVYMTSSEMGEEKSTVKTVETLCAFNRFWLWIYAGINLIFMIGHVYCQAMVQYFRGINKREEDLEFYVGYWSAVYLGGYIYVVYCLEKRLQLFTLLMHILSSLVYILGIVLEVIIIQDEAGKLYGYEPCRGAMCALSFGLLSAQLFQIYLIIVGESEAMISRQNNHGPDSLPGYYDRPQRTSSSS